MGERKRFQAGSFGYFFLFYFVFYWTKISIFKYHVTKFLTRG